MPSPPPFSSETAAGSLSLASNGTSRPDRNGETLNVLPNGLQNTLAENATTTADRLRAQKEIAKAQLSSTEIPSEGQPLSESLAAVNGSSNAPKQFPNGIVETRKRSRSGTRIRRSLDTNGTILQRGPNDPDGSAIERFRTRQYVERDHIHTAAVLYDDDKQKEVTASKRAEVQKEDMLRTSLNDPRRRTMEPAHIKTVFGTEYAPEFGNSFVDGPTHQLIFPTNRPRAGRRVAKHVRIPKRALEKHADRLDDLVPVRLDIEWNHPEFGKIRLRDTFTWNLHDRHVPAQLFAENLVEDFGLPLDSSRDLVRLVVQAMDEQIQDYYPHVFIDEGSADPNLPYMAYKDDELRIIIKLNITIGQHTLVDQFEWDMNNSGEAAEVFARQMACDEALSGEFTTAIAHSIREQVQLFTRSLYVVGYHFDGSIVTDEDIKSSLGPSPMPSALRPYQAAKEFTPYFYELNDAELEKTELSQSREDRRQKRSVNRRGGPTLPDLKDRQRTIRTLVISSVIPGAAEHLENSRIFKRAPATTGKAKRSKYAGDGEDSEDDLLESDDSSPEDAIPNHLLVGTARTRGMRGAATAAQAAVRGALGRSATPESATLHHHETRTSGRRFGGRDYREDSVEDAGSSLVVKLRIGKERFRRLVQDMARGKSRPSPLDVPAHATRRSLSATPRQSTPGHGSMGPPTTPSQVPPSQSNQQQSSPKHSNPLHPHAAQLGRVNAHGPPTAQNPAPPPPSWLLQSLSRLQQSYPDDKFEGTMRYTAVSLESDLPVPMKPLTADGQPPPDIKLMYYPRIKCLDCPGKLYTPGPETGVNNFEVHLKNRIHREKVDARVGRKTKGGESDD